MCGIAGVFLKSGRISNQFLTQMAEVMAHRGPDGEGSYIHGNFGFIHKRLSILDVEGGTQPISNKNKTVHIIANGEIYNYKQLNDELNASTQTSSDTESALYAYLKWGGDFAKYLQGMYAISLFDENTQTMYLARDPFGIKPLYIAQTTKGLAFASEPSVLTNSGWIKAEVEESVLSTFFNRQYVGGKKTLFKGIQRVEPGEIITVKNGEIIARNSNLANLKPISNINNPLEEFDKLFSSSIKTHLQSDVPYGAFLSGGIDSSAMVTAMAEIEKQPIKTYTVGFESQTVTDERNTAQELATRCKTKHNSVNFNKDDFWNYLPKMCEALDDLVADYAALPLLKLAEKSSEDVKVILSGEGGDEIFAGYGRYRQKWWHRLTFRSFRGKGDIANYANIFNFEIKEPQLKKPPKKFTKIQKLQWLDIQDWLPDDLLLKVDRCLMRYGIEGRVPYLDDKLASFAFALNDNQKIKGKNGKWLLKTWLNKKQPFMNVFAKKKGFTVPIQAWINENRYEVSEFVKNNQGIREITNKSNLAKFFKKPLNKKQAKLCFSLLCYAHWHNKYIPNS